MCSSVLVFPFSVLTFMAAASPSTSASNPLAGADPRPDPRPGPFCFAVYALSRGNGVPVQTRAVFEDIERQLLDLQQQQPDMRVNRQIIGLEGETRLCVSIVNREVAEQTYRHIRQLGQAIGLLNISLETCGGPD